VPPAQPPLLDAHALIRSDDPARYPWQPLGPALEPREMEQGLSYRELLAALDSAGVERAILIQRARLYGYDNRYVRDAAASDPRRLQWVCQLNAEDPACAQQAREALGAHGAVGLRFMEPTKGASLAWLDSEGARSLWSEACEQGVPVSVHFFPWNRGPGLAALARLLGARRPRALVLDSFAGSAVETGEPDYGIDASLRALLEHPGTYLKLTQMTLTRLAAAKLSAAGLIRRVVSLCGAARVLWGTDVLSLGQSYESAVGAARDATATLTAAECAQILYGNAASLYPLR